jgi:hypothetical protein
MPFDLVIDEDTASGESVRVSKTSVCGSWGAIAGDIRYFADKMGIPRGSIEGTQISMDLVRRYATAGDAELVFEPGRKRSPLVLRRRVTYFGFELEREVEAIDVFPEEHGDRARRLVAEGLARAEVRHWGVKRNHPLIEEIRETYRRSGGRTAPPGLEQLADLYESRLGDVRSLDDLRRTNLDLTTELDALVPPAQRAEYARLPSTVMVRDREVEILYDVEDAPEGRIGVARLRLPEKLARSLTESELPALDRPLRFVVTRGARGAARASTLDALQEELERPFTEEELENLNRTWEERREQRRERSRQRRARDAGRELRDAARSRDDRPGRRHRRKGRPGRRERNENRRRPS